MTTQRDGKVANARFFITISVRILRRLANTRIISALALTRTFTVHIFRKIFNDLSF
jgi:hypothetical protein